MTDPSKNSVAVFGTPMGAAVRHGDFLTMLEKRDAWMKLALAERAFRKLVNENYHPTKADKIKSAKSKVRRMELSLIALGEKS